MTAALGNTAQGTPFATGVDAFVYPQFIGYAQRAPTTQDIYNPGTRWQDNSVSPAIIYETTGAGNWFSGEGNHATTTTYGTVILTDNNEPVATKFYADNLAIAGAPAWSETVSGIGQLSTTLEATTGTDDNTAMTPLKVAQVLAGGGSSPTFTNVTITGTLGVAGLTTLSGSATVTTGATALNLASDASTGDVNIGTGAGARSITVGNITGATAVAINTGTGSFTVTTTGTGDIVLNSDDTMLLDADGVLELNSSAGAIGIGNDADAQAINIGTGAAARTITLGNSTGATSLVLDSGTGAINIGTNAIAHTVSIGNSTGATAVVIDSGTGAINVGTNAIAHIVTLGNVTGATAVNINTGTAGSTYTTTNGIFTLATGTGTISVSADATATTVNLATGAGVKTVTLGSTNSTSATTVRSGSGALAVTSSNGTWTATSGTGAMNISADAAATTLNIGTGAASVKTINIGGTGANVIAIANTQTGGHLSIASVAKTLLVNGGAVTDFIGTGTLVAGTATIANTNIATGDVIILTRTALNATPAVGVLFYTITNATSFTVTSTTALGATAATDVSSFAYFIVRPT